MTHSTLEWLSVKGVDDMDPKSRPSNFSFIFSGLHLAELEVYMSSIGYSWLAFSFLASVPKWPTLGWVGSGSST